MPKVLLDLRMVRGRLHGIARYALELARTLPRLAPSWEFEALVDPGGLPEGLGELHPPLPLHRARAPFLSPLEQPALALGIAEAGCDLFHATSFSVPALWFGRLVATLHDANHLTLREQYGRGRVAYYRLVVGPRCRLARAVLTVSEFSRRELAAQLGLDPYRIQVIPNGVDPRFRPPTSTEVAAFRARHGLPARYFAAVGNTKPFKNLAMLARIAPALPLPIALLAGEGAASALGFPPEKTIELPDLAEAELPLFYGGATALLLPSLYEGFGLPALESMACGTPVLANQGTALEEVVGEAGLRLPDAPAAWSDAALRIARDERLARDLREKGLERALRYTWEECARRTLTVYERALR